MESLAGAVQHLVDAKAPSDTDDSTPSGSESSSPSDMSDADDPQPAGHAAIRQSKGKKNKSHPTATSPQHKALQLADELEGEDKPASFI